MIYFYYLFLKQVNNHNFDILNPIGTVTKNTVTVVYKGSDELGDKSKYGQGTYNYIGFQKEDKSAIYAQSQADYDKKHIEDGHRSVILIDWQNSHNWRGMVRIIY